MAAPNGITSLYVHPGTLNVGIGTSNPRAKLEVAGNILPSSNMAYDIGSANLRFRDIYLSGNTIDLGGTAITRDANTGGIKVSDPASGGAPLDLTVKNLVASNVSVIGDFVTLNTVTSNTEQVVVTNSGTGPALKVTQTGAQPIADFYDDGGVLALRVADGGNVGIGTANPQNKLHVWGGLTVGGKLTLPLATSATPSLQFGTATTYTEDNIYQMWFGGNGQMGLGLYSSGRGYFSRQGLGIHIISSEEFSVKSSGWDNLFGIEGGTGNTKVKGNLTVNGEVILVGSRTDDVPWGNSFRLWNRLFLNSHSELHVHFGNVGGSTPSAQLRFMYGNGLAFRTARDTYGFEYNWVTLSGTVSSKRYKANIQPLSIGLREVLCLNPVEFKWNIDICGNKKGTNSFGFIAEEMESINKMFVQYDPDGNLETVRYQILTSLLTKAIQELHHNVQKTIVRSGMAKLLNGFTSIKVYEYFGLSQEEFNLTYINIRRITSNESSFTRVKSVFENGVLNIVSEDENSQDEICWQVTADKLSNV